MPNPTPTVTKRILQFFYFIFAVMVISMVGMIGTIIDRSINDGGLMPRSALMNRYACEGFPKPFSLIYRHGKDSIELRVDMPTGLEGPILYGDILNGKIIWLGHTAVNTQLGFFPPVEVVYDAAHILRVVDPNLPARTERLCNRKT